MFFKIIVISACISCLLGIILRLRILYNKWENYLTYSKYLTETNRIYNQYMNSIIIFTLILFLNISFIGICLFNLQ